MTDDKRKEYTRRWLAALKDSGRMPGDSEWAHLLGEARAVVERRWKRRHPAIVDPSADIEDLRLMQPGNVQLRAESLLGLEAEINRVRADLERAAALNHDWLSLINQAQTLPGPGEVDVLKLERALETGRDLPRDAERQLLEIVREVIRWRSVVARTSSEKP